MESALQGSSVSGRRYGCNLDPDAKPNPDIVADFKSQIFVNNQLIELPCSAFTLIRDGLTPPAHCAPSDS